MYIVRISIKTVYLSFFIQSYIGQFPSFCIHHCGCKTSALIPFATNLSRCKRIRGSAARYDVSGADHKSSAKAIPRGHKRPSSDSSPACSDHNAASEPKFFFY